MSLRFFAFASAILSLSACVTPAMTGAGCVDSSDCHGGSACITRVGAMPDKQCMLICDTTMTRLCEDGSVCRQSLTAAGLPGPQICYLGGTTPTGGTCQDSPECVQGAICVCEGAACSCVHACRVGDATQGCDAGQTCTALAGTASDGFCTVAGLGQSCTTTDDCLEGSSCQARVGATPAMQCMQDCDRGTTRLCSDHSLCFGTSSTTNAGVCYLGGTTAIGATCTQTLDCALGGVCVCMGAGNCSCQQACRVGDATVGCPENFTCTAITTGTDGSCRMNPPPAP